MHDRGQGDAWGVGGLVALLVLIAIGALVTYEVTGALDTESARTAYTDQTVNSTFSDNTGNVPDNWDNAVTDNSTAMYENFGEIWVASDNTDNGTCEWYQALTVTSIYDGVSSATILANYQLSDNTDLENLQIRIWLDDGTDNNLIFFVDNTLHAADNSTWYSVDNDVTSYITAAGTYYLRLYDNTERGWPADNYVSVRWDNASLTVITYGMMYAENAIGEVEEKGSTVFSLLSILAIVIVAALIIGVVIRSIGGGMSSGGR